MASTKWPLLNLKFTKFYQILYITIVPLPAQLSIHHLSILRLGNCVSKNLAKVKKKTDADFYKIKKNHKKETL